MKRTGLVISAMVVVVATAFLLPAAAEAQAPVNLTGSWRFSVTTSAGSGTPTVTLKQQGDTLTGLYSSQIFGEQQIKGSVKDREFTFSFTTTLEGTTVSATFKGTAVSADSLNGTVSFAGLGEGTFSAKRQSANGIFLAEARSARRMDVTDYLVRAQSVKFTIRDVRSPRPPRVREKYSV